LERRSIFLWKECRENGWQSLSGSEKRRQGSWLKDGRERYANSTTVRKGKTHLPEKDGSHAITTKRSLRVRSIGGRMEVGGKGGVCIFSGICLDLEGAFKKKRKWGRRKSAQGDPAQPEWREGPSWGKSLLLRGLGASRGQGRVLLY